MASTKQQFRFDATRPFYAAVGVGDLAVELARTAATDVQTRLAKVDLEPKALGDQGRTIVSARVDELNKGVKDAQAKFEARVAELQKEAKAFPGRVETLVAEARSELNDTVDDLNKQYVDLAARGKSLVTRIRKQQATQDVTTEAKKTTAKAKTTKTQATKSASTATKSAAKSASGSAGAAKKSAKATGTSAKKTASATKKAAGDAASKTGA